MNELFLKIINMSISASWLVLAVLILRFFLKKAPKWVNVLLWGIVAVRLICPFSFESALSLIPSSETIPLDIEMAVKPTIDSGVPAINSVVNPVLSSFAPPQHVLTSANPLQIWIPILNIIYRFARFFHREPHFFCRLLYTEMHQKELVKCNYKCTLPALFSSV